MRMRGLRVSGALSIRRSKVPWFQVTKPPRLLLFELLHLFGVAHGLELGLVVLDLVLRRFGDDHALGIEAGAPRAAGDLMKLARPQAALLVAVELGEAGEQHGVDGNVDAHAQGVGTADDGQQALLGELLDQQAVARQQSRVVKAHAAGDKVLERLAKRRGEAAALDGFLDGLALLFGGYAVARQRPGARQRGVLREVDDVQRRVALAQRQLNCALETGLDVFV